MKKVVSTIEGYTFFIGERVLRNENGKKIGNKKYFVDFETGKHMSGQEIADSLCISRSSVSQSLKRSLTNIFFTLREKNKYLSSFEIILLMSEMLNIKTEIQYKKFFKLFNREIKGEVYNEYKYKSRYRN